MGSVLYEMNINYMRKIWDFSEPISIGLYRKMRRLLIICFFMVCSFVVFGSSSLLLQQSVGGFERDHQICWSELFRVLSGY